MNKLMELKRLLADEPSRVSGVVSQIGKQVLVFTSRGSKFTPLPTFPVKPNDLVVLEAGQIIYNLGQKSGIPRLSV